jgi:hypothetical protein
VHSKTKVAVKCAHCGKENETTVAR